MSLVTYTIKRFGSSIGILLVASVIVFSIVRLAPGDPARTIVGPGASDQAYEAVRRQLGLDQPAYIQYFDWLFSLLTGDWGSSLIGGHDITWLMLVRYPRSLQLAITALAIAILIAFPLGILAATRRNSIIDYLALLFSQIGVSMPSFWLGILGILLFASYFAVLPASGHAPLLADPVQNLRHIIMPAAVLGVINAAILTRYLRSEMLEILNEDYVRTARAYGHPERKVVLKYVLKNALLPTLTVTGIQFGTLIGGVVIIEVVFGYPGVGRLILTSLLNRDYPVSQVAILVLAATYIVVNFIVDLLYGWLDPQVRY